MKYRSKTWSLGLMTLLAIAASSEAAKQPLAGSPSEQDVQKFIEEISDEDLQYFMQELASTGRNPYPKVDLDIWLLKAIEEPQHALALVQYLYEKGLVSKSLPWFSKIKVQFSLDFPMHRAASLGKVEILAFLLEKGVTKYDPDHMFSLALEGGSIDTVKLLLKRQIYNKKRLYGSVPSVIPQLLTAFLFGIIPLVVLGLKQYGVPLPPFFYTYVPTVSFAIAILLLLYLLMNMPKEGTEGIGYLHFLSTLSTKDDVDGSKAANTASLAEILILHGANPNQRGSYIESLSMHDVKKMENFTPLHGAVKRGNLPLVKILLEYGAQVNALAVLKQFKRDDSMDVLEDGSFVQYLPLFGSIESRVIGVYTPLDFAARKNQNEVYDYLIKLKGFQRAQRSRELRKFLPA